MGVRILLAVLVVGLACAGPAVAQDVYSPVRADVDGSNCEYGEIDQCVVPSGKELRVRGGETEVGNDTVADGTPVRIATAGPSGPIGVVEGAVDEYGRWSLRFQPRVNGFVYAAQILLGGAWVTIPNSQVQTTVFAQFVGEQMGFGPRNPVFMRGRVGWVDRDGVGRVEMRRCRYASKRRCDGLDDFTRVVTSKRMRRPGGGRFVLQSTSRLAYGRPLALVYVPGRGSPILGDFTAFRAVPRSYRPG